MPSNQILEQLKTHISSIKNKELLEETYYEGLAECLKSRQYDNFKNLFNASIDFNIFIDAKKIPNRFAIISRLLLNCTERVTNGYQTSALGEIIDILRFSNEYNLFEREISKSEKEILENIKQDKLLLENLDDLFGNVSNSFILFVYKVMPQDLYEYFINEPTGYFLDPEELIYYIKNVFFNQYSIYGLSVRYLSPVKDFIKEFNKNPINQIDYQKEELYFNHKKFIEIDITYKYQILDYDLAEEQERNDVRKHLVSPENILKNIDNILSKKNFKFYSLSMILQGGLGPQGLGFTYSTPKGEVIEICSDNEQNKAIIIKFKKFLKEQFIQKLDLKLTNLHIREITIQKIVDYLAHFIEKEEFISYFSKKSLVSSLERFLYEDGGDQDDSVSNLKILVNDISNTIQAILRPIKMMDQYKVRMDLIAKGLLKSEDMAKLTSLKEKSHYDILRERHFFQYIIEWFYEICYNERKKN